MKKIKDSKEKRKTIVTKVKIDTRLTKEAETRVKYLKAIMGQN